MSRPDGQRTVAFLPDAGSKVGFGHVGRCIALAEAFGSLGWRPAFRVRDASVALEIRARGFDATAGPFPADVSIVDSYRNARAMVKDARMHSSVVAAIDDLHQLDGKDADWLIRPSLGERAGGHLLGGAPFVLLRREYWSVRPRRRHGKVRDVLVTLGAFPALSELRRMTRLVDAAIPGARIHVALGLRSWSDPFSGSSIVVHRRLSSLRDLIRASDLVITAGGQTMYECLALGTAAVVVVTAENQRRQYRAAVRAGAVVGGGILARAIGSRRLQGAISELARSSEMRARLARRGAGLVDGKGAIRVAQRIAGVR